MGKIRILLGGLAVFALVACQSTDAKVDEKQGEKHLTKEEVFVAAIEQEHQKNAFLQKELIAFDLSLYFGGKPRFIGTVKMTPSGDLVRMEDSSKVMLWDGKKAYISPDTISYSKGRFDLLTWSYFFAAAYKLSDPGTRMEYLGDKELNGVSFEASKLSFEANVGDSPDDWYIVYKDQSSNLLAALAYIVTYGKSKEAAESDPHAISYEAYETVAGIPIATQWNFWTWNEAGELNKLLGEGIISNVRFTKKNPEDFKLKTAFRELGKPLS
jgi:hypothetical protein